MAEIPPNSGTTHSENEVRRLQQLEQEAQIRYGETLDQVKVEVEQLQSELADLLKAAREKHNQVQEEQRRFNDQQKQGLDAIISEAKKRQKAAQHEQARELAERRKQLEQLDQKARQKIDSVPSTELDATRRQLEELVRRAVENQKQSEAEQRAAALAAQKELMELIKGSQDRQGEMQRRHLQEVKQELVVIVNQVADHLEKVKDSMNNLRLHQKQALAEIFSIAHQKHAAKRAEHENRMAHNETLIIQQHQAINEAIAEGDTEKARKIQSELFHKIAADNRAINEEAEQLSEIARQELAALDHSARDYGRQLHKQHETQLNEFKRLMREHASRSFIRIEEEITQQTRNDLEVLHTSILNKRNELQAEHLEVMKQLEMKMQKQAEDSKLRRFEQQKEMLMQITNRIAEMERHYHHNARSMVQDQHTLMELTNNRLHTVKTSINKHQEKLRDEQMNKLERGFHETTMMIKQLEEEKRRQRDTVYKQEMDEKIRIGREASEAQRNAEVAIQDSTNKTRQAIAAITQQVKEKMQELEDAQRGIIDASRQEIYRLTQMLNREEALQEKRFKEQQDSLKESFRLKLLELTEREGKIETDQQNITELAAKAQANQISLHGREKGNEAAYREQVELLKLVTDAQAKQARIRHELKAAREKAYFEHEMDLSAAKSIYRVSHTQLLRAHEATLVELDRETEEKVQAIRKEQKHLAEQREKDVQLMLDEAESVRQSYRQEQQRIMEETQKRLSNTN